MKRTLLLMRHAKSDWNDASQTDKARPLNQRGRLSAPKMAKWIVDNDLLPNIVICSSAVRTQQTLELMMQHWNGSHLEKSPLEALQIIIEDRLYLASHALILSTASNAPDLQARQRILVLGHNPGIEILASHLSEHPIEMPTGAIAVLDSNSPEMEWPADWTISKMWKWRGLAKPREIADESI